MSDLLDCLESLCRQREDSGAAETKTPEMEMADTLRSIADRLARKME
jgi:hypothetical protein